MAWGQFAVANRDYPSHSVVFLKSCRAAGFEYCCCEVAVIVIFTFLFKFTTFFN